MAGEPLARRPEFAAVETAMDLVGKRTSSGLPFIADESWRPLGPGCRKGLSRDLVWPDGIIPDTPGLVGEARRVELTKILACRLNESQPMIQCALCAYESYREPHSGRTLTFAPYASNPSGQILEEVRPQVWTLHLSSYRLWV